MCIRDRKSTAAAADRFCNLQRERAGTSGILGLVRRQGGESIYLFRHAGAVCFKPNVFQLRLEIGFGGSNLARFAGQRRSRCTTRPTWFGRWLLRKQLLQSICRHDLSEGSLRPVQERTCARSTGALRIRRGRGGETGRFDPCGTEERPRRTTPDVYKRQL